MCMYTLWMYPMKYISVDIVILGFLDLYTIDILGPDSSLGC